MALKDLFGSAKPGGKRQPTRYSVNDLIALDRWDEARAMLEKQLRSNPRHHHARLKLADLLVRQKRGTEAIEQYLEVADGYASDGFYGKAHALLAKLSRLMPHEAKLHSKMKRVERAQELERRRGVVSDAVRSGGKIKTSAFAVQHLWTDLVKCPLVETLSERQLIKLFRSVEVSRLEEGDKLVETGEDRYEMFIIVQGEVAAQVLLATGKRTDLRVFSSGDIIGENALLKRSSWPALYVAKRRTSLLSLGRAGLEELLVGEEDPRGLLDALRAQGHDGEVSASCAKLSRGE